LEETAVRVEAGRVQDRVVGSQELGDLPLELLVRLLRATDEAHARETEPPAVNRGLRCLEHLRVRREAEVVARAEVENRLVWLVYADSGTARGLDPALPLLQASVTDFPQLGGVDVLRLAVHAAWRSSFLPPRLPFLLVRKFQHHLRVRLDQPLERLRLELEQ